MHRPILHLQPPSAPTWVKLFACAAGKHAHAAARGHWVARLVGRAVSTRLVAGGHRLGVKQEGHAAVARAAAIQVHQACKGSGALHVEYQRSLAQLAARRQTLGAEATPSSTTDLQPPPRLLPPPGLLRTSWI